MADRQIVAELVLDEGKWKGPIKGAAEDVKAFKRALASADKGIETSEKHLRRHAIALRDWSLIIGQSRNVIHQLWYVTGRWATSLVRTSAEVERLTFLMKGMSKASTDAAKAAEAASNVKTLFDTAKNAPFTVNALSDAFVKFKSVGLDPLDGSMQSLVDAVAAFGGTDETLHRASIAIQQMGGKGVISMEELRQQLGEAVPQAITIMAQTLGTSYGDLVKLISEGKVAAEPALKAMFNGFQIVFGGRAQALMDSFNGKLARFKTTWTELVKESPGISSFFEATKDFISSSTDFLGTTLAQDIANGIGEGLATMMRGISTVIQQSSILYSQFIGIVNLLKSASIADSGLLSDINRAFDTIMLKVDRFETWVRSKSGSSGNASPLWEKIFGLNSLVPTGGLTNWVAKNLIPDDVKRLLDDFLSESMEGALVGITGKDSRENKLAAIRERVIAGLELTPEEQSLVMKSYEDFANDMLSVSNEISQAKARLNQALVTNVGDTAKFGEEIFSREQMVALTTGLDEIKTKIKSTQIELAQANDDMRRARAESTSENGGYFSEENFQRKNAGLIARRNELQATYDSLVRQRSDFVNAMMAAESNLTRLGSKQNEVESIFGDPNAANRLLELTKSQNAEIATAAQRVADLRQKWADMQETAAEFGDGIKEQIQIAAKRGAKVWEKEIEDLQRQFGTEGAEVLRKAYEASVDKTVSTSEERYENAAQIVNDYFDQQVAGYEAIALEVQANIAAEGEAGIAMAAMVAAEIDLILAQLADRRASLLESIKGPTLVSGSRKPGGGGGANPAAQLEAMIESANRKAEELKRRVVDPFAYELPKAIDSAREKIGKLADKMSGGKWTQQMQDLFNTIATNEMTEELLDMADATREIERSLMGERAARRAVYDEEVSRLKDMKARLIEMGIWRVEWEKIIQDRILALQAEMVGQSPLGEFFNQWKDYFDDIEQVGVDTIDSLSQGMADMVTEGKADFADLARSAVNSLLKISFQAALSGVGDLLKSSITGAFTKTAVNHAGSIVGKAGGRNRMVNSSAFAMATRFHTGGIAGNEVPTILEKGEGVFTSEQMKAIGAGMSRGDTKVNIINQTGTPLNADETNVSFSPEGMVLDVVLKEANRPGPFRDSLKRALK